MLASFWSGRTKKHVMTWESRRYRFPILVGAILFTPWTGKVLGEEPLWRFDDLGIYVLAGLMLAGYVLHGGREFISDASGRTRSRTRKAIGSLIRARTDSCRHPIYTGLIAGMLVTGVAVGAITAMLGAVLISLGMWQKARMEEDFLVAELGADAYGSYCRRVPMLIPFVPSR